MYITKPKRTSSNGKTYETILLRESYRENGKVKNRTIANFTHCNPLDVAAIAFALKHKEALVEPPLGSLIRVREGLSVGAVWAVYQVAQRLGIEAALGKGVQGKLTLFQVMARLLAQGSRLSAVRLAEVHALPEILQMRQSFNEEHLYQNLRWISQEQDKVEQRLFVHRSQQRTPDLFLYDVTSSYVEG